MLIFQARYSLEVAAGGWVSSQPRIDLERVRAAILIDGVSLPASTASPACSRCHVGSAISDTHSEPGGVASACRTHRFSLTTQHLKKKNKYFHVFDYHCYY